MTVAITTETGQRRIYETVAERLRRFRDKHSIETGWQIVTDITFPEDDRVIGKASIINPDGKVVATGTAEETRTDGFINKTSAVENCETSCIGRALFAAGYGNGEFCSADELKFAIENQNRIKEFEEKNADLILLSEKGQDRSKNSTQTAQQSTQPGPESGSNDKPKDSSQQNKTSQQNKPAPEKNGQNQIDISQFGFPESLGLGVKVEDRFYVITETAKGLIYRHRGLIKSAGFKFSGETKIWKKPLK